MHYHSDPAKHLRKKENYIQERPCPYCKRTISKEHAEILWKEGQRRKSESIRHTQKMMLQLGVNINGKIMIDHDTVRSLLAEGRSVKFIAGYLECTENTIYKIRRKLNLSRKP